MYAQYEYDGYDFSFRFGILPVKRGFEQSLKVIIDLQTVS